MHSSAAALRDFIAGKNTERSWAGALIVVEAFDNIRKLQQLVEAATKAKPTPGRRGR